MRQASVREDNVLKNIALTTGNAVGEDWDVARLVREWRGPFAAAHVQAWALARRRVRTMTVDARWIFRPNGQVWWWFSLGLVILPFLFFR